MEVVKGRCQWRNPVGPGTCWCHADGCRAASVVNAGIRFMCSTDTSEAVQYEPWPNDMFAAAASLRKSAMGLELCRSIRVRTLLKPLTN